MIREALLRDLEILETLERECFPEPWNRRMIESELVAPDRVNLVSVNEQQVTGYLLSMQIFEDLHVNKVGTFPAGRRRGVARELMTAVAAIAEERGCTLISLEVRDTNFSARAFYESLGFEVEYVRRRYYPSGEDALVMSRRIVSRPGRSAPPEA